MYFTLCFIEFQTNGMDLVHILLVFEKNIYSIYNEFSGKKYFFAELVYWKLQPYRQLLASMRRNLKLSANYYGPFKVLQQIGAVAYNLDLPQTNVSGLLI